MENWLSLIFNEMDGKDQILFILRKIAVLGDHTTEVGELLQLLYPDCDSPCLGRVAHVHDIGIIATDLEANFAYFFQCCHGMMHIGSSSSNRAMSSAKSRSLRRSSSDQ